MDQDLEEFRVDEGYCEACLDLQGGREQRVYRFPNGLGASLISSPRLGRSMTWTIVALRFEGDDIHEVSLAGVPNGAALDWASAVGLLSKIRSL